MSAPAREREPGPWPTAASLIPALPHTCVPLCYSDGYNITAWGLERLHAFDSCKYRNVFTALTRAGVLDPRAVVEPPMLSEEELHASHTRDYLASLRWSVNLARILEVPPVAFLPACVVRSRVLNPMLRACKGSILAAHYALQRGWGINLSGGYHHASAGRGHGFCVFNDITMAVRSVRAAGRARRVLILDLDAHQGDGHETDFAGDPDVCIVDCYRRGIFPNDSVAAAVIHHRMYFRPGDDGKQFLRELGPCLAEVLYSFRPDLVIYNAGTDCLDGDPLSGLSISAENVILRDEVVFRACGYPNRAAGASSAPASVAADDAAPASAAAEAAAPIDASASHAAAPGTARAPPRFVPVVMLLSGGYQAVTADVIARSIQNLHENFGLLSLDWRPPATWGQAAVSTQAAPVAQKQLPLA